MGEYELYHASTRKHKYIKKIGNRYFYTQQEIAAYLKGKKGDVSFEKIKDYSEAPPKIGPDGKPQGGKTIGARMYYGKDKDGYNNSVGVTVKDKKIQVYNTGNQKFWKDGERWSVKRHGRLKSEYAEDGSSHTLDLSDKKTFKKRDAEDKARERKLATYQESQGWRDSDAVFKEKQKKKRKKAVKAATRHATKNLKSLAKQAARGKEALEKMR